jgi:hypothetical protein
MQLDQPLLQLNRKATQQSLTFGFGLPGGGLHPLPVKVILEGSSGRQRYQQQHYEG